jgi:uncharacterized protein Yka (UPF0111/DUF47 family)
MSNRELIELADQLDRMADGVRFVADGFLRIKNPGRLSEVMREAAAELAEQAAELDRLRYALYGKTKAERAASTVARDDRQDQADHADKD